MVKVMSRAAKVSAVLLMAALMIGIMAIDTNALAASRPAAPKNVEVSTPNNKGKKATVKLRWDKVEGAKAYKVYVSAKKDKGYKLAKKVRKNSFKKKYSTKKNFFFKVRAVKDGKQSAMSLYAAVHPGKSSYNSHAISIDNIYTKMNEGNTRTLKASGDGKLLRKYGFRYKSSKPKVASIVSAKKTSCRIKAHKAGTTVITIIAPNGVSVSKKVTVNAREVEKETKKTSSTSSSDKKTNDETKKDSGKDTADKTSTDENGKTEIIAEDGNAKEESNEPKTVKVPSIIGMEYKAAEKALIDAGLAYHASITTYPDQESYEKELGSKEPCTVLTMQVVGSDGKTKKDVAAGDDLPWGTRVYITTAKIKQA